MVLDPLDDAWSHVRDDWSNEARHRLFVERCRAATRLDVAARRYREAIKGEAIDYRWIRTADAERRLGEVITLAQAGALVPSPRPNAALLTARTLSRFALGVVVLVIVVFLVLRALT